MRVLTFIGFVFAAACAVGFGSGLGEATEADQITVCLTLMFLSLGLCLLCAIKLSER
jgi:putative Ca2+/H+ antiporter (TMEM165/GDT1 family)